MKKLSCIVCILIACAAVMPALAVAPAYEMINVSAQAREDYTNYDGIYYRGFIPTINNLGHYAFTVGGEYAGGGHVHYSDGVNPAYNIGVYAQYATISGHSWFLRINDNDLIVYTSGSDANYVADPSGWIHTFDQGIYTPGLNNSNRIALIDKEGYTYNVFYSDEPYDAVTRVTNYTVYSGSAMGTDMNNSDQIVWSSMDYHQVILDGTIIASGIYGNPKIADTGEVIYYKGTTMYKYDSTSGLTASIATGIIGEYYVDYDISDNGQHIVWTQEVGSNEDVFTLVDGTPVNVTDSLFAGVHHFKQVDVNNSGQIICSDYTSKDVYLLNSIPEPAALSVLLLGITALRLCNGKKR